MGAGHYATLRNAKQMGPQLTSKTLALIVENFHKNKLLSDEQLDDFLFESIA